MGFRSGCAKAISAISTWGLKYVFHRPAANFPGKIALYADPRIILHTANKLTQGSICVVGTNGKTTITNMIADALEANGASVVCNRTGANLDSGIATALLHANTADWGVFESDELWLAKSLPQLQSKYVLLLNLFRDQLDRCGEIDRIQNSIVAALASSPNTVLIYNGDDPLCEAIARRCNNESMAFGIGEELGLQQNTVSDARMCQLCPSMLEYVYRQYGQLGNFSCPNCDFRRAPLTWSARRVVVGDVGMSFDVVDETTHTTTPIQASYTGVYMIYNLLAVFAAARLLSCESDAIQKAVDAFKPDNGRLQTLRIGGRDVLLNLAKNPTGFNQNLKLVTQAAGRKAAVFFINDKEADGHDISWIWDVDFEELAGQDNVEVFAGGIRKNDLQVRLKYAGTSSTLVDDAQDAMRRINNLPDDYSVYMIANYTALPAVKAALTSMAAQESGAGQQPSGVQEPEAEEHPQAHVAVQPQPLDAVDDDIAREITAEHPLTIVHMYPDLLNLYGDGGNVAVLRQRCAWRGIPVSVQAVEFGQDVDLDHADIVFLGGGPDREQELAGDLLMSKKEQIRSYAQEGGVVLGICGGYQILGETWLLGEETREGLGVVAADTRRAGTSADRLIDNIALSSPLATHPVVGYENHASRTYLESGVQPFGTVVSHAGHGNNDNDGTDGVISNNVVGTYLHGPLLGKNPQVADWLIMRALERRIGHEITLPHLDDTEELAANAYMAKRLNV